MRVLWLKTELLHPVDKGGKIRTYHVLRGLRERAHVTYLCLDDGRAAPDAVERAAEYCHELVTVPFDPAPRGSIRFYAELVRNLFSPLPYAVSRWRDAALEAKLKELAADADVIVCDFLAPSPNVPEDPGAPVVLFQHNVEALIWKRHAEVASSPLRRAYMRQQWRRMTRFEERECRRHDRVLAVSDADRELMEREYGVEGVEVVPTGVDVDFFRPDPAAGPREPHRLVFTGSMDWMPNQDGMTFFLDRIFPGIRQRVPDATLDVVGRNPPPALEEAAARDDAVRVTGFVDDIRPWLQRAAVAVVPLRVGGGTRLKIYEAMAMETPVVSTTIGAEGLPLRPGEDVLLADEPEAFTAAVVRLLRDEEEARALGARAARRVRSEFGWDSVARRFETLCREVMDAGAASAAPAPRADARTA